MLRGACSRGRTCGDQSQSMRESRRCGQSEASERHSNICVLYAEMLKWQMLRLRNAFSDETMMAVLGRAVKEISWLEKKLFLNSAKVFAALADATNF